jgi:hypothetical protein
MTKVPAGAAISLALVEAAECVRRLASPDPSLETSVYILKHDRPFSNLVAVHNRFGASQKCWK